MNLSAGIKSTTGGAGFPVSGDGQTGGYEGGAHLCDISQAPLCVCGCGKPASPNLRSIGRWNRYAEQSCRQRVSDKRLFEIGEVSPVCACGCGRPARINKQTGRPTLYATNSCRWRVFQTNQRLGLTKERLKVCACGCGAPLEQKGKRPQRYATKNCYRRQLAEAEPI